MTLTLGQDPPSDEREPLFTLDGTTYTVLKEIPGSWAMQGLRIIAQQGEAAMADWAMNKMLGPDAVHALSTSKSVSMRDIRRLQEVIRDKLMGALEEEGKG